MERAQSEVQLDNSVVAIIGGGRVDAAVTAVEGGGNQLVRLAGPEDTKKLAPNQEGAKGALSKLAAAFGDELPILEEIERALRNGDEVLIVRGNPDEHADLSKRLMEHGATSVWDFRGWTFAKTGEGKSP